MTKTTLEKLLTGIVRVGLFATLAIPFITLNFLIYPSINGQALMFQFLIEFLLLFYLPLVLLYPRYRPRLRSKTTLGILVYFGALFVTALFSANPQMSYWSSLQRSTGIVFILHILAYYFMLVSVLTDAAFRTPLNPPFVRGEMKKSSSSVSGDMRKDNSFTKYNFSKNTRLWFLRALAAAGAVMAIIVILQSFNWAVTMHGETRPYGTLGNSDFLGTYLLFSIYFSLLLFIKEKNRLARGFAAIAFALIAWALIANATRAVFVGIAASVIFYLLIAPFAEMPLAYKKIYRAIAAIFAVSVIFIVLTLSNALPNFLYNRVALLQRIRDTALHGNDRVIAWQSGWRAFHERPITGFGPENFSIGFNKGYDSRFGDMLIRDEMMDFDKAHNIIIEILGTSGIIGIAGYIFFILMLASVFWRYRGAAFQKTARTHLNPPFVRGEFNDIDITFQKVTNDSKRLVQVSNLNQQWFDDILKCDIYMLVLAALFIAYQTHLLFSLDTPASFALFIILLALVETSDYKAQTLPQKSISIKLTIVCAALFALAAPFVMNTVVIKPLQANYAISKAKEKNAPLEIVFKNYSKAIEYNSVYTSDIVHDFAKTMLAEIPYYDQAQENIYSYLEDKLKKYANQYNWQEQLQFARAYNILCDKDLKYCDASLLKLALAKKLAPNRPRIYTEGFVVAYKMHNYALAQKFIEQAVELGYSPEGVAPMQKLIEEVYSKNQSNTSQGIDQAPNR